MSSRQPIRCRPHVLLLEDRLPLGDAVLGLLAGASLLPAPPFTLRARGVSEGLDHASLAYASGSDRPLTWLPAPARRAKAFAAVVEGRVETATPWDSVAAGMLSRPCLEGTATPVHWGRESMAPQPQEARYAL